MNNQSIGQHPRVTARTFLLSILAWTALLFLLVNVSQAHEHTPYARDKTDRIEEACDDATGLGFVCYMFATSMSNSGDIYRAIQLAGYSCKHEINISRFGSRDACFNAIESHLPTFQFLYLQGKFR